jgi:hypothetical protein
MKKEEKLLIDFFKLRRKYFDMLLKEKSINNLFTCPSCWFPTLSERRWYEICILCNWEDDWQDDYNSSEVMWWPNWILSLDNSRINFEKKYNFLFNNKNNILKLFIEYNNLVELDDDKSKIIEIKIKKIILMHNNYEK